MGLGTDVTNKNIRILLVDDHQVVRDGLQHMLEQETGIEVIGQGADAEQTFSCIRELSPDIVLMDIKMPGMDGIELTRQVRRQYPDCKIIMLTLYDQYLSQAMEAGASGYLLKDIKCNELVGAIKKVYGGETVTSESIRAKIRFEYEHRDDGAADRKEEPMVEELQVILPPPIEANQLMRLSGRIEHALESRVLQVNGAWEEGTIMTIALKKAMIFSEVITTLGEIPEVSSVLDSLPESIVTPKLMEKANAVPRLHNRIRKIVCLTLDKK